MIIVLDVDDVIMTKKYTVCSNFKEPIIPAKSLIGKKLISVVGIDETERSHFVISNSNGGCKIKW